MRQKIALCIVSLFLGIIAPVYAQTALQGVTEQYAPYTYEENGKVVGIVTEIVQAMCEKAGLPITIKLYPWARAYDTALNMPDTLIFSIFRTPEREELFHWIGPVVPRIELGLYKLKERSDLRLSSLEDAKRYRISVVRDSIVHEYLLKHGFEPDKNIDVQANPDTCMKVLFGNRVDFIFGEEFESASEIKALGFATDSLEEALHLPELNAEFYVAISKQTSENIVQRLRKAFDEMQNDGSITAILEKYRAIYQH